MKKFLILTFMLGAAATASAQSSRFSAAVNQQNKTPAQRQAVEPRRPVAIGAFPRAARGNPLQLLNPLAPARYYGPPQETVVSAPQTQAGSQHQREEPQYAGVILFGWRW